MHIMIVDDDLTLLDMMAVLLEHAGHTVMKSTSGVEAIPNIKRNPPDVLITDLMMAELDGLEFCREVAKNPDLSIKIIFISARTGDVWKERAQGCGAVGYIEKPIEAATFAAQVESLAREGA